MIKIGLLPLYIELYDKYTPEVRRGIDEFNNIIILELKRRGFDVINAPVCRLREEFGKAIKCFENNYVSAIVTLHLAYSPSLESAEILSKTKIPIIVLDTTPAYESGLKHDPEAIMYNHGVVGVQDMCNMLKRNRKRFVIEAGHWEKSDVIDRVALRIREAMIASTIRRMRVGIIGNPFNGMGDFYVPFEILTETIGIEIVKCIPKKMKELIADINNKEIEDEIKNDIYKFECKDISKKNHHYSVKVGIAIRKWIKEENLGAFTMNFLDISKASGFITPPFLEASKAMARGIGYGGEGDVLTAALTGALMSVYPDTSFAEISCPDWKGNSLFLNHMGEMNLNLTKNKPRLVEKDFKFTDVKNPIVATGCFKPGNAVLINLAPDIDNSYSLIVSGVSMLDVTEGYKMKDFIRGWLKPKISLSDFFTKYSEAGGGHHFALVYGDIVEMIIRFGKIMGWNVVNI